jgi:hypothetical protein
MRFLGLKVFRGGETLQDAISYLQVELANSLRDLTTGLGRLKLLDNFEGFEAQVSFSGAGEVAIRHNLGYTPSQRIIVRASASDIIDGTTPWDNNFVYLQKTGAGAATATVIFLR